MVDTAAATSLARTRRDARSDLRVLGTAEYPLRAKDICLALGIATTANHTESLRAKLKRLVTRGVLTEDQPGLFALAPSPAVPADATVA